MASSGGEITAESQGLACGGGVAVKRETVSSNNTRAIWTRSRRSREGADACALVYEDTAGWIRRRRLRVITCVDLPEEIVVWEILVRLPAKALLRCRAVCRSWYTLTSASNFLVAHHKHQPSLPLIQFSRMKDGHVVRGRASSHTAALLRTCNLRRRERRPVICLSTPRQHYYWEPVLDFTFSASCDGLLLLSSCYFGHTYYICNPATRECAPLPGLTGSCGVAGLYLHRSSGEYRVLYWKKKKQWPDVSALYYILTVGSPEPRCIGVPVASSSMEKAMLAGMDCYPDAHCFSPVPVPMPVLLHDWPDLRSDGQHLERLVVFDTVLESFRWMRSPPATPGTPTRASLFEMDGVLGISCLDVSDRVLKIWLLQDYGSDETSWSLKFQVQVPAVVETSILSYIRVMSLDKETLICYSDGSSASCSALFHCDISNNGELLIKEFTWKTLEPTITGHWFKESIVRHAFFQRQGDDVRDLCFFQGL